MGTKEITTNLSQRDAQLKSFPCRVCHEQVEEVEVVHNCRIDHLLMMDAPRRIHTKDFILYRCPQCSHYQIAYYLPEEYYEGSDTSDTGQKQYTGNLNQTESKIQRLCGYSFSTHSIIEIGCGDIAHGSESYRVAKTLYEQYVGVDPSAQVIRPAKQAGLPVIEGYFNSGLGLPYGFSSFMALQVFEHMTDLYGALNYAMELLEPGGVGLINVPNGRQIIEENLYHQVIAEHVNYFTPESLLQMSIQAGFEIIELRAIPETIELDLYIRKPSLRNVSMDQTRNHQRQALHTHLIGCQHIGIWGAGYKALIYSSLLSEDLPIAHLFDSDPEKLGKYIGNLPVPVEPICLDTLLECDAIVIFASSYNNEIIKTLQKTFCYPGKIIYFDNSNVKCY